MRLRCVLVFLKQVVLGGFRHVGTNKTLGVGMVVDVAVVTGHKAAA